MLSKKERKVNEINLNIFISEVNRLIVSENLINNSEHVFETIPKIF